MAATQLDALVEEETGTSDSGSEDSSNRSIGMRRIAAFVVAGGVLVVGALVYGAGPHTIAAKPESAQEAFDIGGMFNSMASAFSGASPEKVKDIAGSAKTTAQQVADSVSKHAESVKAAVAGNADLKCGVIPCSGGECCGIGGILCCSNGCDSGGMTCKIDVPSIGEHFDSAKDTAQKHFDNAKQAAQKHWDGLTQADHKCGAIPCSGECCGLGGIMCCTSGCDSSGLVCKIDVPSMGEHFDSAKDTAQRHFDNAKDSAQKHLDSIKNSMSGGAGNTCGVIPCPSGSCCGAGSVLCCSQGCDSSGMLCKMEWPGFLQSK